MEDHLIVPYIGDLNLIIQDQLALQGVWTMVNVVDVAMKVENKVTRSTRHYETTLSTTNFVCFAIPKGHTTCLAMKTMVTTHVRPKSNAE